MAIPRGPSKGAEGGRTWRAKKGLRVEFEREPPVDRLARSPKRSGWFGSRRLGPADPPRGAKDHTPGARANTGSVLRHGAASNDEVGLRRNTQPAHRIGRLCELSELPTSVLRQTALR